MRGLQSQNMKLASSELHQRLEHLITYSTQMIFVSGEGVGRKFQLAEDFLSEQGADTNVAYFPASDNLAVSDYRQKILSQLTSGSLFDTSRPLAESFSRSINQASGSLLICITSADNLPKPFLKELWDLVLQNRFARDRFHLNVVLFADEQWATQAKSWLPSQHQEQPVLVSTATQQPHEENVEGSELEQLIAEKRQQFAKRIEQRKQSYLQDRPLPIIKTWWMKLLLACVFVLSFGSILLWQHYDVTREAIAEFANFLFQSEVSEQRSNDDNTSSSVAKKLEIVSVDKPELQLVAEAQKLDVKEEPAKNTEALVIDWQSAVRSLDDKLVTVSSENSAALAEVSTDSNPEPQITAEERGETTEVQIDTSGNAQQDLATLDIDALQTGEEVDYPVPDIVAETNSPPLEVAAATQSAAVEYAYQEADLLQLPEQAYVLQLAAMSSSQVLQEFIQQHQLESRAWIYVTQRYGGDWHVLLLASSFNSLSEARSAASELSTELRSIKPFAKSLKQVHKEINSF